MNFKKRIFCINWVGAETLKEHETTILARSKYKAIKILFKQCKISRIISVTEVKLF